VGKANGSAQTRGPDDRLRVPTTDNGTR